MEDNVNRNFEKYQEKLVLTYKRFLEFCSEHELRCWACGGTAIGAVRHNNIIPWDDDVDVFMLKEDMERLGELEPDLASSNFRYDSINKYGYNHTYAKLYDTQTTVWENKANPIISGVWIDIYPLYLRDGGTESCWNLQKHYSKKFMDYHRGIFRPTLRSFGAALKNGGLTGLWEKTKDLFFYHPQNKRFYKEFVEFEKSVYQGDGANYVSCMGIGAYVYNREWFDVPEEFPFADFTVLTPKAHEYLTYTYGNYMKLPPEGSRRKHSMYYVNLNERLPMEEVKKRIRKGVYFE